MFIKWTELSSKQNITLSIYAMRIIIKVFHESTTFNIFVKTFFLKE